jgi:hypothetical protein
MTGSASDSVLPELIEKLLFMFICSFILFFLLLFCLCTIDRRFDVSMKVFILPDIDLIIT